MNYRYPVVNYDNELEPVLIWCETDSRDIARRNITREKDVLAEFRTALQKRYDPDSSELILVLSVLSEYAYLIENAREEQDLFYV